MQFNVVSVLSVLFMILNLVIASPVQVNARGELIVYRPKINQASVGAQWERGQKRTITWDLSSLPKDNNDLKGTLILGFLTSDSENLDIEYPLARNFPLAKGSVTFTVPKHLERKSGYIVALLGDSGNISEPFAVV